MTGAARTTITTLLVDLGAACAAYQDRALRNLTSTRIECDEIWAFCYAKAKNVPDGKRERFGYGDVWTWTAIDPDTKLVPSWLVGTRDAADAKAFIADLGSRLANRVQITTDGHSPYIDAIESEFGPDVDYAQLIKQYGVERSEDASPTARRYSPNVVTAQDVRVVPGDPDPWHYLAPIVERPPRQHGYHGAFSVGSLLFQILGPNLDRPGITLTRNPVLDDFFSPLWPLTGRALSWPPRRSLGIGDLELVWKQEG